MATLNEFVGKKWLTLPKAPNTQSSSNEKSDYYPNDEVVIQYEIIEHKSKGAAIITAQAIQGKVVSGAWSNSAGFNNTIFQFYNGILVSHPMETGIPDGAGGTLELIEVIEIFGLHKDEMLHTLQWSDGDKGTWGCRRAN